MAEFVMPELKTIKPGDKIMFSNRRKMGNWDYAIESIKSALPFTRVFGDYDVNFDVYKVLFESKYKIVDRILCQWSGFSGNAVRKMSGENILSSLFYSYNIFCEYQNKIIRKYAKHKLKENKAHEKDSNTV